MVVKAAPVHPFDAVYGTETGGLIPRAELVTGHANDAHVTAYYAVAPSILDGLVEVWLRTGPLLPVDRYTFLDVGAGKGRAMLQASLHPFAEVVGVELNTGLAAAARANVTALAASGVDALSAVRVVEGDVLEVDLPAGPVVAFLFHPFEAPMMRRFLARVAREFVGREGRFDLLYVNAEHATVIDGTEGFVRVWGGVVAMSAVDHLADLAEIEGQAEYGSTGDEVCAIYRYVGGEKELA